MPKVVKLLQGMGIHASIENTVMYGFFVNLRSDFTSTEKATVVAALQSAVAGSPYSWTVNDNVQSQSEAEV